MLCKFTDVARKFRASQTRKSDGGNSPWVQGHRSLQEHQPHPERNKITMSKHKIAEVSWKSVISGKPTLSQKMTLP